MHSVFSNAHLSHPALVCLRCPNCQMPLFPHPSPTCLSVLHSDQEGVPPILAGGVYICPSGRMQRICSGAGGHAQGACQGILYGSHSFPSLLRAHGAPLSSMPVCVPPHLAASSSRVISVAFAGACHATSEMPTECPMGQIYVLGYDCTPHIYPSMPRTCPSLWPLQPSVAECSLHGPRYLHAPPAGPFCHALISCTAPGGIRTNHPASQPNLIFLRHDSL